MSLQIGPYLGLKELHVSRCVWRGFILDCDVDMRLCVVKLAKKPVVCARKIDFSATRGQGTHPVNRFHILWPYNTPQHPRKKHYNQSISTDNICN